jgi:primosomal protein N'
MLDKEELEHYKNQVDKHNDISHLFNRVAIALEKSVLYKIISSHLEALARLDEIEEEVEGRDRMSFKYRRPYSPTEDCDEMEVTVKCPKCHSELEKITDDGLHEGIVRCICKKCDQVVEVSVGEPYLPAT